MPADDFTKEERAALAETIVGILVARAGGQIQISAAEWDAYERSRRRLCLEGTYPETLTLSLAHKPLLA